MLSGLTKWVVPALFGVLVAAAPAQAVPIAPGVPVNPTTATTLYTYNSPELVGGSGVNDVFTFVPVANFNSNTTVTVLNPHPSTQGNVGIANLLLEWRDAATTVIGSLLITEPDGDVINAAAVLSVLLLAPGPYTLTVTGTVLALGGFYDLSILTGPARANEVPLPPAVILFGSALVGLAMLKRRRSRRASEFAAA